MYKGLRVEGTQQGAVKHPRGPLLPLFPLKRFLKPTETCSCRRGPPGRSCGHAQRNTATANPAGRLWGLYIYIQGYSVSTFSSLASSSHGLNSTGSHRARGGWYGAPVSASRVHVRMRKTKSGIGAAVHSHLALSIALHATHLLLRMPLSLLFTTLYPRPCIYHFGPYPPPM